MARIRNLMFFIATAALFFIAPSPAQAGDDGCWSGRYSGGPCLEYSSYVKKNKTYVKLRNRCTDRLYMKWCVQRPNGRWSCGADGLRGGQTKKKYEFTKGRVWVRAIGSKKGSQDWVCARAVSDWRDH